LSVKKVLQREGGKNEKGTGKKKTAGHMSWRYSNICLGPKLTPWQKFRGMAHEGENPGVTGRPVRHLHTNKNCQKGHHIIFRQFECGEKKTQGG